jgi:hypothetical protein
MGLHVEEGSNGLIEVEVLRLEVEGMREKLHLHLWRAILHLLVKGLEGLGGELSEQLLELLYYMQLLSLCVRGDHLEELAELHEGEAVEEVLQVEELEGGAKALKL